MTDASATSMAGNPSSAYCDLRAMWHPCWMPRYLLPVYAAALVCAAIIGFSARSYGWLQTLTAEGHGLEISTALVHSAAAILLAMTLWQAGLMRRYWSVAALVALFALRELDFNDWWFEPGVLEIELLSSDAPLWHKAVSVAMIALVTFVILRVFILGVKPLWASRRELWAKMFAPLGLTVVLSLILDHPAKTARQLGYEISQQQIDAIVSVEEISEFLMAAIILLIICLYRSARSVGAERAR